MDLLQLEHLEQSVYDGYQINSKEARWLVDQPLEDVSEAANRIRQHFMGNLFDICTIINAKSGKCSENCRFCAQSSHYETTAEQYPLLKYAQIAPHANDMAEQGIMRYSLVTSGRTLSRAELSEVSNNLRKLQSLPMRLCGSFGLLDDSQLKALKASGLTRIHNNLETNRARFEAFCTTHSYQDKIETIKAAQELDLEVCSGGLFGCGESFEDRISLAIELRALGIASIPINFLSPIAGTPFASLPPLTDEECQQIVAIYRWILPTAVIRLAGGRGQLSDKGLACFKSGANGAISGDLLTTAGISVASDKAMLSALGFQFAVPCQESPI